MEQRAKAAEDLARAALEKRAKSGRSADRQEAEREYEKARRLLLDQAAKRPSGDKYERELRARLESARKRAADRAGASSDDMRRAEQDYERALKLLSERKSDFDAA